MKARLALVVRTLNELDKLGIVARLRDARPCEQQRDEPSECCENRQTNRWLRGHVHPGATGPSVSCTASRPEPYRDLVEGTAAALQNSDDADRCVC